MIAAMRRRVRWRLLAGMVLVMVMAGDAEGQRRPAREAIRERITASREEAIRRGLPPRTATFALTRDAAGAVMVSLFVSGGRDAEAAVASLGGTVGVRAGSWFTTRLPVERLGELIGARGVLGIEPARYAEPMDDWSKIDIGATEVRRRGINDQWEGATGRGAIVGIVDTGIDYEHPDFFDDDVGRSRVLWLWDQTAAGTGPGSVGGTSFGYGAECTREMMTGAPPACRARDVEGHGTHVAGTAAGDGSASRRGASTYSFTGVAPGADLIVVKSDFSFTGIADGVAYIFRRAEELGRPAVVNLSLGTDVGPHDGMEALSLMLDSLSGPGRVIVAAAGNGGRNIANPPTTVYPYVHGDTVAVPGDSAELRFDVPSYTPRAGVADVALVAAYYPPGDEYALTVVRPNGTRVDVPFAPPVVVTSHDADGSVYAYHGTPAAEDAAVGRVLGSGNTYSAFLAPASPLRVVELYLGEWRGGAVAPRRGTWRLVWRRVTAGASGQVDGYIALSNLARDTVIGGNVYRAEMTFTMGATNRRMIGTPGDAGRAITVAAYNTDSGSYTAANGTVGPFRGFPTPKGELLYFSAPGPRTDGVLKPEIAAPGRVFSSLSRYGLEDPGDVFSDSSHVIYEGTSMATPHVTGAVALLLAERPSLTPEQVRSALTSTARWDAQTAVSHASGDPGGRPNWSWGYGKLWLPGALAAARPGSPFAGAVRGAAGDVSRAQEAPASSRRGTLVLIQTLRLSASDADSLDVATLVFSVTGADSGLRLAVAVDANRNGALDPDEDVAATSPPAASAAGGVVTMTVAIPAGRVQIPRGGTLDVLVLGVMSGSQPNGARIGATLVAEQSTATGLRSGATVNFAGQGTGPAIARTTVLGADERFEINQNPVRRAPLIMNYVTARRIEVYDFSGRLVRRFDVPSGSARTTWDLTNERGRTVANGAYMIVADLGDRLVRRRLFVVR